MKHVVAAQALKARVDIGGNVSQWMAHMQAGTRWVGEHIENVELGSTTIYLNVKSLVLAPVALPLLLNFRKIVIHGYLPYYIQFESSCENSKKVATEGDNETICQ